LDRDRDKKNDLSIRYPLVGENCLRAFSGAVWSAEVNVVNIPVNIPRRDRLVHSLLDEAVAETPDSPAVRDATGGWTYRQLDDYGHAVDAWLRTQGVRPGDRVVVQLPTTRELAALFYGTSRSGAVFVPLNPAMKTFHLRSVIENAEPRLVIGADSVVAGLYEITDVPIRGFDSLWLEVEAIRAEGTRVEPADIDPGDIAVLIYTSGSTASPKGVIGPHAQVTFASWAINAELGYRPDDVVFCRFPMSWDYGLYKVLLACLGRSEIVLAGTESDLLLLKRMREVGATVVPIVPSLATMIATLAEREDATAAPVRMFTNTGAALPATTIAKLREAFPGVQVVRQFGQTECKRISIMPPGLDDDRPESVGRPLPGTKVLIVDAEGRELPAGQIGEIVATGRHVMPGYWRSPELSARTFRRDADGNLRLHTGDYGRLDADGYLYFEGRRDDMFKRKGIRMSTLEIEAAAMDIPGVRAAGAIPPSEARDLVLCVETDLAPHTVLRELAKRLEPAKVPAICHVVEEFPLTAHGKNATKELASIVEGAGK
jgi:acyl-CoA synthetase (AMP-forming)/AMP-acid ligase II